MDFGKILDEWESEKPRGKGPRKRNPMHDYVDQYSPNEAVRRSKAADDELERERAGEERRRLLQMAPERTLDLHRLTAAEALVRVDEFVRASHRDRLKKILIVHGKGKHSRTDPVLGKRVVEFVRHCPLAGEYGSAPKELGGSGALWVILRYRSR